MGRIIFLGLIVLASFSTLSGCAAIAVGGAAASGALVLHDRRSSTSVVDDQAIEFKAFAKLREVDRFFDDVHSTVTSYNGIVLISGEAPDEDTKNGVTALVGEIPQVQHVYNEMVIAPPSSFMSRSNDSLITSKVKFSLFKVRDKPGFDPTRVKVVTENGTVFLMGLLRQEEAEAAAETTRRVAGVKRVVKLFEYLDSSVEESIDTAKSYPSGGAQGNIP